MYPPDFVCRVKHVFPDCGFIHCMLDSGDLRLGAAFQVYLPVGLTSITLISEIANNHDNENALAASRLLAIQGLYDEWELIRYHVYEGIHANSQL